MSDYQYRPRCATLLVRGLFEYRLIEPAKLRP
jgi:hypothetical protein